jgi:hypothetical protein
VGVCPKYLTIASLCSQEEEERKAREEQARREHEEYLKLKEAFVVEEEGVGETMTEEQVGLPPQGNLRYQGSLCQAQGRLPHFRHPWLDIERQLGISTSMILWPEPCP